MAEFTLVSEPPLAGYDKRFGEIALRAPKALAIVALALPQGGEAAAREAVKAAYGVDLPGPGKSVPSADGAARLVWMGPDLAFVLFERATPDAEEAVAGKLGEAAYLTDQTDTWCALEIEGARARAALERICPIDLHPGAFAVGDAARTVMEHLGVLIVRTGEERFLLLSASSSAGSFRHAVETSIHNVS